MPSTTKRVKGRSWVIVNATLLVEGTHCGSHTLFYPRDELAKAAHLWEGVPIVVNHPELNGSFVDIMDPRFKPKNIIGWVRRPSMDRTGTKLQAECWLDVNKTPSSIVNAVLADRRVELSTGLYTDNERRGGEVIARNHKPDHLAILPDDIGACSLEKGCGLGVAT